VRAGRLRHLALKATVSVASIAFLTINFGLIDLADGLPAMGALALLVVALPLLAAIGTRGGGSTTAAQRSQPLYGGSPAPWLPPPPPGRKAPGGHGWAAIAWALAAGWLGVVEHARERRYFQYR
jgi:hypothetical protein